MRMFICLLIFNFTLYLFHCRQRHVFFPNLLLSNSEIPYQGQSYSFPAVFPLASSQAMRSWMLSDPTSLLHPLYTMWRNMSGFFISTIMSSNESTFWIVTFSDAFQNLSGDIYFCPQTFQLRAHIYQVWQLYKQTTSIRYEKQTTNTCSSLDHMKNVGNKPNM